MANILQQGIQKIIEWSYDGKQLDEYEELHRLRRKQLDELIAYFEGKQRRPLKKSMTGRDYNVLANLTGIIINRSVSMLVGAGVDFSVTNDDPAQQFIKDTWEANHGDILLHDLAQSGSIYGTAYLKIIPGGRQYRGKNYDRVVVLNPYSMIVYTAPDDIEEVVAYVNRWNQGDDAYREITINENGQWYIRIQTANRDTKGRWQQISEVLWEQEFPPISHVKNLPNVGSVYGLSDIEGVIELQDRYNAAQSDINVILANNAFPLRYTSGGRLPRTTLSDGSQVLDVSPSKIIESTDKDFRLNVAEMQSDLQSSRSFASDLRRDIFDISATVDTETFRMNAANMTNFGLKIMFQEELAKNNTKQMLYGSLLDEINSHLLTMAGLNDDPGEIIWGDPLPVNDIEEITALTADYNLGIASKKTIATKRNYDWVEEEKQLAEERSAAGNLGGDILRSFLAGRGEGNQ